MYLWEGREGEGKDGKERGWRSKRKKGDKLCVRGERRSKEKRGEKEEKGRGSGKGRKK